MADTTFYYSDSTTTTSSDTNLSKSSYDRTKTLVTVQVGTAVISITNFCFADSISLTYVTFNPTSSVTSLGNGCFIRCSGLTSITIPNSVTSLGDSCFNSCSGLTSITIPDSVTSLRGFSFQSCTRLTSITIPDSVTSFGEYCFILSGLTSITIPSSLTSLGYFCFGQCFTLTTVVFNNQHNLNSVEQYTFFSCPVTTVTYKNTVDYADLSTASKSLQTQYPGGTTYIYVATPPCFKKGTKILTDNGYKRIEDLRKGDLVKTLLNDYKPIYMIGKKDIHHAGSEERIKDQLYKCSPSSYPEVFEPLIITGCHSILVDAFVSNEQREKVIQVNGDTYVTDKKYRLPACADERASVYESPGNYTIYHLALENDDYYMNYGIYANGLLVETCSKRYLKELSNMIHL